MQNGIDVNLLNAGMVANAMNAGVTNPVIDPRGIRIHLPNPPQFASTNANLRVATAGGAPHLVQLQQHQQQQQRVLGEQRMRLFEYERQRADMEKRREEELRKREAALRQMEIRRQEEIRARRARENEMEDQRRQQIELQQSRQFLQQLLHTHGNQNAFITQPSASRGYPGGQSTYRVVVNSAPRPQLPSRSPPRIIELPPDE